jgi:hypothetical protein
MPQGSLKIFRLYHELLNKDDQMKSYLHHRPTCFSLAVLGTLLLAGCSRDASIKIPDAVNYEGAQLPLPENADARPIQSDSNGDAIGTSPALPEVTSPVVTSPAPEPTPVPEPVVTTPVVTTPVVTPPVVTPPVVTPPTPTPTPAPAGAIANGNYTFQGVSSGRCIDVSNGQTWDGLQMQIWDCIANEPNQTFKIEWVEGNYYRISTSGNKAIEGRKNGLIVGSPVQQGTYAGEAHQLFAIESTGSAGKYYLKSKVSNLVVDLAGDFRTNGSYLQFASQLTVGYQQWILSKK